MSGSKVSRLAAGSGFSLSQTRQQLHRPSFKVQVWYILPLSSLQTQTTVFTSKFPLLLNLYLTRYLPLTSHGSCGQHSSNAVFQAAYLRPSQTHTNQTQRVSRLREHEDLFTNSSATTDGTLVSSEGKRKLLLYIEICPQR